MKLPKPERVITELRKHWLDRILAVKKICHETRDNYAPDQPPIAVRALLEQIEDVLK